MANIKPYLKIILPILFILAALLGLSRRSIHLFGVTEYKARAPLTQESPQSNDSLQSYLDTANSLKKKPQSATDAEASFIAVGDIMLSRDVADHIIRAKDPTLTFQNANSLLTSGDFNFGNLESPLSGSNTYTFSNQFIFNAPPYVLSGLKQYFRILNTANNHSYDQGKVGIDYTLSALAQNGITTVGTGSNLDDAWQGKVVEKNGVRIGFLGASYTPANTGVNNDYVAVIKDTTRLTQAIAVLRQHADFIVVAMHAGVEYTRTPNPVQTKFAHAAIDAGADMIIGAHPHWIQPLEQYKGKYIFYSLGNFVFDQGFSQDTKEGLALKVTIGGNSLKEVDLIPVIIEHNCCPRLATTAETKTILTKINQPSGTIIP